jgi:hypothetical protein
VRSSVVCLSKVIEKKSLISVLSLNIFRKSTLQNTRALFVLYTRINNNYNDFFDSLTVCESGRSALFRVRFIPGYIRFCFQFATVLSDSSFSLLREKNYYNNVITIEPVISEWYYLCFKYFCTCSA